MQRCEVVHVLHLLGGDLHDPRLPGLEEGDPGAGHPAGPHRKGGDDRLRHHDCHTVSATKIQ